MKYFLDFLKRVFGSSYVVEQENPTGNMPATHDFRKCENCNGVVFTCHPVEKNVSYSQFKKCGCRAVNHTKEGFLRDKKDRLFEIPRLYDFILWRAVGTVVMITISILTIFCSWHGAGNIFIDSTLTNQEILENDILQISNYPELILAFILLGIISLIVVIICIFYIDSFINTVLRKKEIIEISLTLVSLLFIYLFILTTPTHYSFAKGQVMTEEETVSWRNAQMVEWYNSLIENREFAKAAEIAKELSKSGDLNRLDWRVKELSASIAAVRKNLLSLDEYVDTLKLTKDFFPLYIKYLQAVNPILAKMHCKNDPWMMYSSLTPPVVCFTATPGDFYTLNPSYAERLRGLSLMAKKGRSLRNERETAFFFIRF